MDSRVTAGFFKLSFKEPQSPDYDDLLLAAMEHKQAGEREKNVGDGVTLRLEHCDLSGDFLAGEFCRKQTSNIPPQAGPDGLSPIVLEDGQGLGHVAAFRYHRTMRLLLLQYNPLCATANRLALYLSALHHHAFFIFKPVLREDAWERFKDKKVKSMTVSFASPDNLDALDDAGIPAAKGAKMLAEAYHGVDITITVSVGRKRKSFLNFPLVSRSVAAIAGSDTKFKKLKVRTEGSDEDRKINFIEEHLKHTEELQLPEHDPANHYHTRKDFLARTFDANMAYLEAHFGANADGNNN